MLQHFGAITSSGGKQIDKVLNGSIGLVIRGFQFAVGSMRGIGPMVEPAVGRRTAEAFVEEQVSW